ncbi:MAG: hypothetical protein MHMPM18_001944 [Marteilia pararefringens]
MAVKHVFDSYSMFKVEHWKCCRQIKNNGQSSYVFNNKSRAGLATKNPIKVKWTLFYRRKNKKFIADSKKKKMNLLHGLRADHVRTIGGFTKQQLQERSSKISEEDRVRREEQYKQKLRNSKSRNISQIKNRLSSKQGLTGSSAKGANIPRTKQSSKGAGPMKKNFKAVR